MRLGLWLVVMVVFILASIVPIAPAAWAGSQQVLSGHTSVAASSFVRYDLTITMHGKRDVRLRGRVVAAGGTGNDIEIVVLRAGDVAAWDRTALEAPVPLYRSERLTSTDVDVLIGEPGAYALIFSNRFSLMSAKDVEAHVELTWEDVASAARPASVKGNVQFVEIPEYQPFVEVPFREHGNRDGRVVLEATGGSLWYSARVRRMDGSVAVTRSLSDAFPLVEAGGTLDLHGDGDEDVFLVGGHGGSGATTRELAVVCPRRFALVTLTLTWITGETLPEVSVSENGNDPAFAEERDFLEQIKWDYGYTTPDELASQRHDPELAWHLWKEDNGNVADGPMTIRRYKGSFDPLGSTTASLTDGTVQYWSFFKGGVAAYDAATDEHYVLFHPRDPYCWPTILEKAGPYLVIGTNGEGLAFVDLRSLRLKRLRLGQPNDVIERIEVNGNHLRVNGRVDVALPTSVLVE